MTPPLLIKKNLSSLSSLLFSPLLSSSLFSLFSLSSLSSLFFSVPLFVNPYSNATKFVKSFKAAAVADHVKNKCPYPYVNRLFRV